MKTHERPLSEKEKQRLASDLAWFGRRRKEGLQDIDRAVVEVHEFHIDRIWDINGCRPPCCPFTLLFRTTDGLFVYVETWQEIEQRRNEIGESGLRIESTPAARKILKTALAGDQEIRHTTALREFVEVFETSGEAEWRMYQSHELPARVRTILEAV